ncbi:MAG TPA: hypothetical protein VNR36_12490 [Pseudolysinimonas sp.]|nr:hypothetical protein [Pseudolysinimonas sp.]
METFAELLATGEPGLLVLAIAAFAAGGLLALAAARTRPRPRRRSAGESVRAGG